MPSSYVHGSFRQEQPTKCNACGTEFLYSHSDVDCVRAIYEHRIEALERRVAELERGRDDGK